MKLFLGIFCCLISFAAGIHLKAIHFYSTNRAFLVNEELKVSSKEGVGVIPKGTEMYLHSNAHKTYTYYMYIDVPHALSDQKITEVDFDSYGGIKRVNGVFEEQE